MLIAKDAGMNSILLECSMQKLKKGNKNALDEIYNFTSKVVYVLAYSILKNKERAEDIVQETYLRVYKKIEKYKSNTNAAAWIYRIARNLAYDEYSKRRDISLEVFEGNILDKKSLDHLTESVYLKSILDKLNNDEKEVVVLFTIGNFKHRELAEIVGKPMGTVQWLYNKSIKKLKEILSAENETRINKNISDYKNNSELSLIYRIKEGN